MRKTGEKATREKSVVLAGLQRPEGQGKRKPLNTKAVLANDAVIASQMPHLPSITEIQRRNRLVSLRMER